MRVRDRMLVFPFLVSLTLLSACGTGSSTSSEGAPGAVLPIAGSPSGGNILVSGPNPGIPGIAYNTAQVLKLEPGATSSAGSSLGIGNFTTEHQSEFTAFPYYRILQLDGVCFPETPLSIVEIVLTATSTFIASLDEITKVNCNGDFLDVVPTDGDLVQMPDVSASLTVLDVAVFRISLPWNPKSFLFLHAKPLDSSPGTPVVWSGAPTPPIDGTPGSKAEVVIDLSNQNLVELFGQEISSILLENPEAALSELLRIYDPEEDNGHRVFMHKLKF